MFRPTSTRVASRLLQQRQFSIMPRIRSAAQSVEHKLHPFQGYPLSQKGAKPDWGVQFRHLARPAVFYFPAFAVLLGWPLAAEKVLDGHIV